MNKINFIIDGAFFYRRSLAVANFSEAIGSNNKLLDTDKMRGIFIRKIGFDFAYQFKAMEKLPLTTTILVNDSGSWRKSVDSEYKANRERGSDVNWDEYKKTCNVFTNEIQKQKVIYSTVDNAEGDDLIYYWTKVLSKDKNNINIIISSDNDLKQVINDNTLHYNVITERYTFTHNFKDKLLGSVKPNSIYELNDDDMLKHRIKSFFRDIFGTDKEQIIEPLEILYEKIIGGDRGDNVFAVANRLGKKSVEKVIVRLKEENLYSTKHILNLNDYVNKFADVILEFKKKEDKQDIIDKLLLNLKLVTLHHKFIPKEIEKEFKRKLKEEYKDKLKLKCNSINLSEMQTILQDTHYVNTEYETDDSAFNGTGIDDMNWKTNGNG